MSTSGSFKYFRIPLTLSAASAEAVETQVQIWTPLHLQQVGELIF